MSLKILAYCTFLPEPRNHGDAIRRGMMLDALNEAGDLSIVVVRRPDTTSEHIASLNARYPRSPIRVFDLDIGPGKDTASRLRRQYSALRLAAPAWLFSQHSADAQRAVEQLSASADVTVLIGEPAALGVSHVRSRRVIWDKSNVLTTSLLAAVRSPRGLMSRLHALANVPLAFLFERRAAARCTDIWVTSSAEEGRLKTVTTGDDLVVRIIPSSVEGVALLADLDLSRQTYVWMSSFGYTDNWIGLRELVLALSQADSRDIILRVVGTGATPEQVAFLRQFDFVDYWGYVENLEDAFSGVRGGVVPVWSGAGVKLKTLTFMRHGVPVFATECGLEGIDPAAAAAIAATTDEMIAAMVDTPDRKLIEARDRALIEIRDDFSAPRFIKRVKSAVDVESAVL